MSAAADVLATMPWCDCLVPPGSAPPELVATVRRSRGGYAPSWVARFAPLPWLVHTMNEMTAGQFASLPSRDFAFVALVVSRDNSCRFCYGAQRALMRILGYEGNAIDRLERDESVVFVARNDARGTIGFAQLYPLFCSVALKRQWLLYDLYVLPEARRTGVARGLLERCRELGIQTGSHALFLETAHTNTAAQQLYESAGWQREAQFVKYNLWL